MLLQHFLEEDAAKPEECRLHPHKIELLKLAANYADRVSRLKKGKKATWEFYFDEGAYKGGWTHQIGQKSLDEMSIINMLKGVGWPGLNSIIYEVNIEIFKILDKRK